MKLKFWLSVLNLMQLNLGGNVQQHAFSEPRQCDSSPN